MKRYSYLRKVYSCFVAIVRMILSPPVGTSCQLLNLIFSRLEGLLVTSTEHQGFTPE